MNLQDIIKNIKVLEVLNEQNIIIDDVKIDSREETDMFIGIKGKNFDGNLYYQDAFSNGAKVCVLNKIEKSDELINYLKSNNKTIILVADTQEFLIELAKYKRSLYNIPVIGVTGSSGKTSTKDFIYNVLSEKFKTLKTEGNHNNHIGVPLTILRLRDHECMVVEMGMDHFGEIEKMSKIAKPTISLINNVGYAHVELLGSREGLLKAKLEILAGMDDKKLVVNNDNDLLHDYALKNDVITFGIDNKSDCMCEIIDTFEYHSIIKYKDELINVPKGGVHFIYNALASIAIGEVFGIDAKSIKKGIEKTEITSGRSEIIKCHDYEIINDCYNANLDAMGCAIRYLALFKNKRKIAVLGTMGELADFVDEAHGIIGKIVAENNIDILVTAGEHTEYMNIEAEKNGLDKNNSYHFTNKEDAIKLLKNIVKEDDAILVKASHFNNFIKIVAALKD